MKKHTSTSFFLWILIILGGVGFIVYNNYFLRSDDGSQLAKTIAPVPYKTYFFSDQEQPSSFFTLPAFPEYAKWCHENKKLCMTIPLQQLYADIQRISSIQFVGGGGSREGINGLYTLLDNVTNLAPYWNYPYVLGQLLIPQQKTSDLGYIANVKASWNDSKILAEKGEYFLCDPQKIEEITKMSEETFIQTVYDTGAKVAYANPCKDYELAHYAAFNAFYYRGDIEDSANNYKISAFQDGSPTLTPLMAALVYGRGGEHLKGATLWFDRYLGLKAESTEGDILSEDGDKALKKAVFEMQLQLITEAADMSSGACGTSYNCLQKNGWIKKSLDHSLGEICENKINTQNIRCIIIGLGLQNKWITPQGGLTYPIEDGMIFERNKEYNSWWITPNIE